MRRIVCLLAALLLLTGCAAERTDTRASELQRKYSAMSGCASRVDVTVMREDDTQRYVLDLKQDGGETRLTVAEPEALAGVCAIVSGESLSLSFDDMVLDAGSVDPEVSAVNAADIVLRAAAAGWITEQNRERLGEEDALRLCFETELGGETLLVTAFFDANDAPLRAEVERQGEILAYLEFTDFVFGDILLTEQAE